MTLQEFNHSKFDTDPPQAESESSYFARLQDVVKNWNSLSSQDQKDAVAYYGVSLAWGLGFAGTAVAAFMARY